MTPHALRGVDVQAFLGENRRTERIDIWLPGYKWAMAHRKIGEILVEAGYLTDGQVKELLAEQARNRRKKTSDEKLGEIALRRQMITPTWLRWALEKQQKERARPVKALRSALKLVGAIAILAIGYRVLPPVIGGFFPGHQGAMAPAFRLEKAMEHGSQALADSKGKVVLINFWATWCPPCQAEIPELAGLYKDYRSQGFDIVGIAMFYENTGPDGVRAAVRNAAIPYPVLLGTIDVGDAYGGVHAVPTSLLVDRRGRIVKRWEGGLSRELLEPEIKPLLAER